jgi:hypothetical protein
VDQPPPPWLPFLLKVSVVLSCPSRVSRTNPAQATTTNDGARARMAFSKIEKRLTGETVNSTRAARSAMIDAGLAGWMISRVRAARNTNSLAIAFAWAQTCRELRPESCSSQVAISQYETSNVSRLPHPLRFSLHLPDHVRHRRHNRYPVSSTAAADASNPPPATASA